MPPPPSPAPPPRSTPAGSVRSTPNPDSQSTTNGQWRYYSDGRVDAPNQSPDHPNPPPPSWLVEALDELRPKHPRDNFEAWMKLSPVNRENNEAVKQDQLANISPENIIYQWLPRIRCNDCPGKVYTALPGSAAENFEIHLKNRQHRERVENRIKGLRNNN